MIRLATKYDITRLVDMMRNYASEAPVEILKEPEVQNADHVSQLLFTLIAGRGFILVDDEYKGMIAALINQNVWCPSVLELRELAWWVEPKHRQESVGGKLWLEFNKKAQEFLDTGRVHIVCTSKMITSPTLDYSKRGFKELETTYFRE